MEINLSRRIFYPTLTLVIAAALVGLAVLGRAHTPDPPRVIWWPDWEALKVERQYREELAQLRRDLAELAETLGKHPDPVRAELAASRIAQRHASGLDLLAYQRAAVLEAAEAVRDWAAGYGTYANAVATVNTAMEIMRNGSGQPDDVGHSRPSPRADPETSWFDGE